MTDTVFGAGANAVADDLAGLSQSCVDPALFLAGAAASVLSDQIVLYTKVTPSASCSASGCSATGAAAAVASARVEFGTGGGSGSVGGNVALPSSVPADGRRFAGVIFTVESGANTSSTVYGAIESPLGEQGIGLTFSATTGLWEGVAAISGGAGDTVTALQIEGPESRFGVDGDARLTSFDAVALAAIVGTSGASDPANVDRFDFDGSNLIDQGDVDVLDALLDAGFGAGVFGDADSDDDADCADYAVAVVDFVSGSVLGDADYEVTYDFDLDGDNDATDRDEIRRLLSPADMAVPYNVLDFTDVIAFNTAFAAMDPAADLAVPFGTFDFSDVIAFNTAFTTGCPN